jgi:hypothetical protein
MTEQNRERSGGMTDTAGEIPDPTFKRHGPEPPENDSGPSPSVEDADRRLEPPRVHNVDPDEQVD